MSSRPLLSSIRIPSLRPLRPPNISPRLPTPRLFTHNSQLLLIAQHGPRPQLPYLSQPAFKRPHHLSGPPQQLARLLSTENRQYFREQLYLATKWTLIGWTFLILGGIAYTGWEIETRERRNPTPADWRLLTRHELRAVRALLDTAETQGAGFVDWAVVGSYFRDCLERLEDTGSKDGRGLQESAGEGEQILIPDLGKAGFDISGKSYEWRTGYFEVAMGCAAAAEHLDELVLDKTRRLVFSKEFMIGPSNPDPRPVSASMKAAPLEENCEPPFAPPEVYYMRVLTGKGFTTKQKLDAALGFANWLEYKKLDETADEMYKWAVDIAKTALPVSADAVIDPMTNVLNADVNREATPNLLRATTALAIHHARTGDLSSALPMLLSVLRARRTIPVVAFPLSRDDGPSGPSTDIGVAVDFVKKVFRPPSYPPPPSSGDEPLEKQTERPTCEESELMLYIGEILFATSPQNVEGLGWTRQAVTIAETNLHRRAAARMDVTEVKKCKECLIIGVGNWETMLRRLSSQNIATSSREGGRDAGLLEWRGWFGGGNGGVKGKTLDELSSGLFGEELEQVERLKEQIAREGIAEELIKTKGAHTGGSWL